LSSSSSGKSIEQFQVTELFIKSFWGSAEAAAAAAAALSRQLCPLLSPQLCPLLNSDAIA
jgi:hypothetical protein